ncbi:MAG TPA: WXG100 family type VII secretion target, partial [Pseudonocardiaceae bacterium]|jgi:uncharacterized protein YukE|nr:WXG100 family type VII secretion target [Pseudonocardiaceae bacterium]
MPGGELNYPRVVLDMVEDMKTAVLTVKNEMDTLASNVKSLAGASVSQAVSTFHEVQTQWNTLLDEHNRTLTDIANMTRQGYEDMIAYDRAAGVSIAQQ